MKKLSFCITCKNRLHHLEKTLPKNLEDNFAAQDWMEFVVVDFGSNDGLQEWIIAHFAHLMKAGYLRYLFTEELTGWHASVAKNTAHYYASGEILVNLDGDNYTGAGGAHFVTSCFERYQEPILFHQFSGTWRDGSYGRIGMHRKHFYAAGGYDESFEPMGYQDMDLISRLIHSGIRYVNDTDENYNKAIQNSKDESIRFCNSALSWEEMMMENNKRSEDNLRLNKLVANRGVFGIRKNVYEYNGECFLPVEEKIVVV